LRRKTTMPLVERKKFEMHPAGVTIGQLADVELDEQGKFGPQILWKFDTDEEMDDGRPFRISFWTTPTLNEKSHLWKLLQAFGEDPEDARWEVESVSDFDDLIGRKVQLDVIHKKTPNGDVSRVDRVMALPKRRSRAAEEEEPRCGREERESRGDRVAASARGAKAADDVFADED
jgi:hypothetical protein